MFEFRPISCVEAIQRINEDPYMQVEIRDDANDEKTLLMFQMLCAIFGDEEVSLAVEYFKEISKK